MFVDRRRSPRFEILGRLHGQIVSLDTPVAVREISLGGLSFQAVVPFPLGAVHEFKLTLGDGSFVLLHGRVVRSVDHIQPDRSHAHITAVQFLDEEPPHGEPTVGDLIDKIR
jgi:PilZ domain